MAEVSKKTLYDYYQKRISVLAPSMEENFRKGVAAYLVIEGLECSKKNLGDARRTLWFGGESFGNKLINQITTEIAQVQK